MVNWYKTILKLAWNSGIPRMDYPYKSDPYTNDPRSLVVPAPLFGGKERKGYPKDVSFRQVIEDDKVKALPVEDTMINTTIPTFEGAGASDLLERFSDPVDKLKDFSKKPDPRGPNNMPHDHDIWGIILRKSRLKGLNKV